MARLTLSRLAEAARARAEIRRAVRAVPALRPLWVGWPMQVKPGRAVFAARLGGLGPRGRPAVVKLIRDPARAKADTAAAWAELTEAHAAMGKGPRQVPEPLLAAPEHGVLVMARAPGRRLTDLLRRQPVDRGAALVGYAADWLAVFTAQRRRRGAFASEFWIGQRAARTDEIADKDLHRLAGHLIVALKMQGARLHHLPVTQVRPHGDFWSHNLIWDGAVMTGIDLQHTSWQPLARDPARFLVHLSLIRPMPEGPWRYGLPACWVTAFEESGLLAQEPEGLLRFFIGVELHHRLLSEARFVRTRIEARAALERYLAGPG